MADDTPAPLAHQLLAELGWVRTLAAQLAGAHGDDVAQEAWLTAACQRPDGTRPLRPWLAAVVRKLAHTRARGEARRRAHEAAAEREAAAISGEQAASPESRLLRAELLHLIGELVARLDEPYRSTILLHYYEGLNSQQIAARLGISDGTARWRLKQALAELRQELDQRVDGGRRAWSLALAALPSAHSTTAAAKGASMITLLKLGSAAAVVLVGGVATVGALRGGSHASPSVLAARPAGVNVSGASSGGTVPGGRAGNADGKAAPRSDSNALRDAKQAYVEGRYDDAIKLAGESKAEGDASEQEVAQAWRVIGASSCFKQDGPGATEAWQALDPQGRRFIEYVCGRNNVMVPTNRPVL
jgi:RNA polymerase sigma-70 factor (ECF subfamily)